MLIDDYDVRRQPISSSNKITSFHNRKKDIQNNILRKNIYYIEQYLRVKLVFRTIICLEYQKHDLNLL